MKSKMENKKSFVFKIRKNPYMLATLILGMFLIAIMVEGVIESKERSKWENNVCDGLIQYRVGTPAWFDNNGILIHEGAIIPNQSRDIVNSMFIPERVSFVYSENCGWCKKQIEYFGTTWETYKDSGLTIKCG